MAERLVDIYSPRNKKEKVLGFLEKFPVLILQKNFVDDNFYKISLLVKAESSDILLDKLTIHFSDIKEFKIIVLPVEASLPRDTVDVEKFEPKDKNSEIKNKKHPKIADRISIDELYSDISSMTSLTRLYFIMLILSSIVAGIGLLKNNTAVVIGAMVIAPLLGPNVGLCFGTTLGDWKMIRKSSFAGILGIIIVFIISVIWGKFYTMPRITHEIISRTVISTGDLVLGFASGCAGTLSVTVGLSTALVGVMIAVALLPPLVTSGLLLGNGFFDLGLKAFITFIAYLICINLSGILTFYLQGVKPSKWKEKQTAKKTFATSLFIWLILLSVLIIIIFYQKF